MMAPPSKNPHIFFHVGLGKTGTTFLQYRVFPFLKGVHYIQRSKYHKAKSIIAQTNSSKYLVSREFDQQLEREVKDFSATYPEATPIIVFRRHDKWIASQYKRFIKNGYRFSFPDFFDLHADNGKFKIKDLSYYKMIQLLDKYFSPTPIVLLFQDLKNNPVAFIEKIVELLEVSYNKKDINTAKKHVSYNQQQLRAVYAMGNIINLQKRPLSRLKVIHFLGALGLDIVRYLTLYSALLLPRQWFSDTPFIPEHHLTEVREYFASDWEKCLKFAEQHHYRPSPSAAPH